jgi:molybdopterin molybdotransferase
MRRGDTIFDPGTTLGPGQVGVLAALGLGRVSVHRSATVAILSNGDELVPLDRFEEVQAGRAIPESNSYALAAAVRELGGEAIRLGIAADTESSVEIGLREALSSTADVLLTVAGASMGETDLFKRVLDGLGFELEFWRVQMRPGSPFSFGLLPRDQGPPLFVFGLPGNPASAFVTFWVLVRPFLLALAGHRRIHAPTLRARAGSRLAGARDLTVFLRVRLACTGEGIVATSTGSQGSGLVGSLGQADGLAVIPGGVEAVEEGQSVEVLLLRPGSGWSERAEFVTTLR